MEGHLQVRQAPPGRQSLVQLDPRELPVDQLGDRPDERGRRTEHERRGRAASHVLGRCGQDRHPSPVLALPVQVVDGQGLVPRVLSSRPPRVLGAVGNPGDLPPRLQLRARLRKRISVRTTDGPHQLQ
eukprot:12667735-Alexandrium_andersonii.AAC.1